MKLTYNQEIDPEKWNQLVGDKAFFRFEWFGIITDSYGLEPYFVLMQDDDDWALIAAFKFKGRYVSLPYAYCSGFLGSSPEVALRLEEELKSQGISFEYKKVVPLEETEQHVTALIEAEDYDAFWKSLSSNMRNQIKKSIKSGLRGASETDLTNFYNIFAKKMHQLGTPVHSRTFLEKVVNELPNTKIFTAFLESEGAEPVAVASLICVETPSPNDDTKKGLNILWAATNPDHDRIYPNYFLYHHVMEHYFKQGIQVVDLGTCQLDSSQYLFKKKWRPTFYSVVNFNSSAGNHKENKKMLLASKIWQHLPYSVTLVLGPVLRKLLL